MKHVILRKCPDTVPFERVPYGSVFTKANYDGEPTFWMKIRTNKEYPVVGGANAVDITDGLAVFFNVDTECVVVESELMIYRNMF